MGCGTVADYGHLPALKEAPSWELFSIFEPHEGRRNAAQAKFAVPNAFDDVDAFFDSGIDAVAITSPAPCHLQNVRDAVRHKKPILCEKPLAMDENEAGEMIALAKEAGLPLFTGFMYRFGPEALKIKELIDHNAIGGVRTLRLVYIWNCHGRYETDENGNRIEQRRREGRMLEGGPMVDCGVHDIDLARWWTGSEVVRHLAGACCVARLRGRPRPRMGPHGPRKRRPRHGLELSYSYCDTSKEPVYRYIIDIIGTESVIRFDGPRGTLVLRFLRENGALLPRPRPRTLSACTNSSPATSRPATPAPSPPPRTASSLRASGFRLCHRWFRRWHWRKPGA